MQGTDDIDLLNPIAKIFTENQGTQELTKTKKGGKAQGTIRKSRRSGKFRTTANKVKILDETLDTILNTMDILSLIPCP